MLADRFLGVAESIRRRLFAAKKKNDRIDANKICDCLRSLT
jgi:hypothetical protein